jgi:hypothetical protein
MYQRLAEDVDLPLVNDVTQFDAIQSRAWPAELISVFEVAAELTLCLQQVQASGIKSDPP